LIWGVMDIKQLLQEKREAILALATARGAANVRIYGAAAQEIPKKIKAVDFLVELEPGRSLMELGALALDLRELLGVKVYVVPEGGLRPRVRERLLQEAVAL